MASWVFWVIVLVIVDALALRAIWRR